jgi:hypothetical protein
MIGAARALLRQSERCSPGDIVVGCGAVEVTKRMLGFCNARPVHGRLEKALSNECSELIRLVYLRSPGKGRAWPPTSPRCGSRGRFHVASACDNQTFAGVVLERIMPAQFSSRPGDRAAVWPATTGLA